ncbi:DNA-binding protein [Bradyrhizobium guangzhouense]|uniref:helix-turn-helix domain-containing transcriptional regulator n=1 Tax=Bradyrhizobium guangzhouense TaxID=1325095 RepID=UPI0010099480|nr:putative addiction module antidote protein [Bradyrhizobium guangzhouense]RXH09509.1 putative addiction module antidote protein [Bradyrhizobium guangzhouense]
MTKAYRPVSPAHLAAQLNASIAPGDPHQIFQAIGDALGDFNISEIARETGLARQIIHRAFQAHSKPPNCTTILAVPSAIGLQLAEHRFDSER